MILVFDVGNTETTIGLFNDAELRAHWRIMTGVSRTPDEFGVLIQSLITASNFNLESVDGVAIGSVVPSVTVPLAEACRMYLGARAPVIVDAKAPLPIRLDVDEPMTVGADRIINTLAASRLFQRDAVVVDMGTATTFDCITADGAFIGGIIAPGLRTSAENLIRRTSKLPATELVPPSRVIGKRTEECVRAGVMFGAAESVDGLVRRIKRNWPRPNTPLVVGTGGYAELLSPLCTELDVVNPHLTLQGLQMAYDILSVKHAPSVTDGFTIG